MKKTYNNPTVELCRMSALDVITSSPNKEELLGGDIGVEASFIYN